MIDTVDKDALENVAYEQIKMAIVEGSYPPGFQIVEESIANGLNMSRSPVRVALRRLLAEGFLEKYPNRRMHVTFANAKRTLDALYIRKALEGVSAYQAALNRDETDISNIRELLSKMNAWQETGDVTSLYKMTVSIHRLIYSVSKNVQLERLGVNALEQESVFSFRSLSLDQERILAAYNEHSAIAESIIQGDADAAERYARDHIDKLIQRVQPTLRQKEQGDGSILSWET